MPGFCYKNINIRPQVIPFFVLAFHDSHLVCCGVASRLVSFVFAFFRFVLLRLASPFRASPFPFLLGFTFAFAFGLFPSFPVPVPVPLSLRHFQEYPAPVGLQEFLQILRGRTSLSLSLYQCSAEPSQIPWTLAINVVPCYSCFFGNEILPTNGS